MDNLEIFKFCKKLGCCDICSIRYMGYKKCSVYENPKAFVEKVFFFTENKLKEIT